MIFEFGNFCVDVDVERTKEFYNKFGKTVIEDCGCINCRNYHEAILRVPYKVNDFFNCLGIDPQKSPEATYWYTDENGIAHYSLYFYIVGTLVNSAEIYRPDGNGAFEQITDNFYEIDTGFKVGFISRTDFVANDFPMPCVQLEINAHLPWVLD